MFTGLALGRPRFLKGRALSRLPPFLLAEAAGVVGVAGAEKRDGNGFEYNQYYYKYIIIKRYQRIIHYIKITD